MSVAAKVHVRAALLIAAVLAAAGCSGSGLLEVQASTTGGGPVVTTPAETSRSAQELVNAGTQATSPHFQIVYTLGQPSPNQELDSSSRNKPRGSIVGAVSDKAP